MKSKTRQRPKDTSKTRSSKAGISVGDLRQREWLRPVDVMRVFGIGRSKLNVWIADGAFKAFRPDGGRTIFIRNADVDSYIKTGRPVVY